MDEIDKREKRAEYRNARQTAGGKGDANNKISQREFSESSYFCQDCGKGPSACDCGRVKELEEAQRWRSVDNPESIDDFDILYLIEKGTGKRVISKKFEVIFPQSGEPEIIYNIKKNYYFLWCNYLDGSSHISGIYGIKLPAKGGSDEM